MAPYYDESPRGSVVLASHLRRRSSVSHSTSTSPQPVHAPFVSHLVYDDKTGEISLPAPPPLVPWKEKNALGLIDYHSPRPRGRAYAMPKPWKSLFSLTGVTVAFIWLMTFLIPSNSPTTQFLDRIRSTAYACDPYSSFGVMQVDGSNADRNRWMPFDGSCKAPQLLAHLRQALHLAAAPRSAPEPKLADFAWMANKTALLIGDLVSREQVDSFCQLLGEESEIIRPGHLYSPQRSAPSRAAVKAQHTLQKPARLGQRGKMIGSKDAGRPRMCYIPSLDFLLVSVVHFGLDQEDYFHDSGLAHYSKPAQFEHRLTDIVGPLISQIRATGRRSAPDFVEVSSGAFDLTRWAEEDIAKGVDSSSALSPERITWYRFRAGQAMDQVRKAFPNAKALTWRTNHFPLHDLRERDYFTDKIARAGRHDDAREDQPHFAHNRIAQLDQSIRSLVLPTGGDGQPFKPAPHPEFRLNRWGEMLKGHDAHQKDRLHGDPLPGGYLWSDVMMYELKRGVSKSEGRPLRGLSY